MASSALAAQFPRASRIGSVPPATSTIFPLNFIDNRPAMINDSINSYFLCVILQNDAAKLATTFALLERLTPINQTRSIRLGISPPIAGDSQMWWDCEFQDGARSDVLCLKTEAHPLAKETQDRLNRMHDCDIASISQNSAITGTLHLTRETEAYRAWKAAACTNVLWPRSGRSLRDDCDQPSRPV
jgi:hypothetical protein